MTPREQLADVLQRSRVEAGFGSQGALAKRLSVSRPVVSKAENAAQPVPSDAILAAWAGVTGAPLDRLTELADQARSGVPDWFVPWRAAETTASLLRYWSPFVVPGIGQTVGYMRALFADEGHNLGRSDEMVAARLERQALIGRIPVTMIIGYYVLYRVVGSPAVMSEQCGHLASMAEQSMIAFHVLPEGITTGSGGALDLASRDGSTTVCLTTTLEDVTSTAEHLVVKAQQTFDRLLGEAMPRTESLSLIRSAEGQWKAQS